jgi:hypothetical protein
MLDTPEEKSNLPQPLAQMIAAMKLFSLRIIFNL